MSRFTILRVEVDSDVVERMLDLTPGVEVVEGFDDAEDLGPRDDADSIRDEVGSTHDGPADDDDGLLENATPDGDLLDEGSPIREYGLLGVGVSFVMLGIATVGIWWYRRRQSDETPDEEFGGATDTGPTTFETTHRGPSESPVDTDTGTGTVLDTDDDTAETTDSDSTPEPTATDTAQETPSSTDEDSLSIVRPEETDTDDGTNEDEATETADSDEDAPTEDESDDHATRSEDREDTEWTTKWDTSPAEPESDDDDTETASEAEEPTRPASDSVDVAPLLGVAFLAVSGAVARWVKGGDQ